jgi:Domain of unknown function (DUF4214)
MRTVVRTITTAEGPKHWPTRIPETRDLPQSRRHTVSPDAFLRLWSQIARRALAATLLAGVVVSLALASEAASAAQLTLSWVDNAGGTAIFKIERKTGHSGIYGEIATTAGGVTTHADSTVVAGITYCYRVKASNSFGDSDYSNEACDFPVDGHDVGHTVTIRDVYLNVLGREPDLAGMDAWNHYLGAHCHQDGFRVLARAFFNSPEFRFTRPLTLSELVAVTYRALLGRDPDTGGLAFWTSFLRQARLEVAGAFMGSPEFQAIAPRQGDRVTATALITRFYTELLGRSADPGGLKAWADYVVATGDVRGTALAFLGSVEFETRPLTSGDYVTLLYRGILGRLPEPAGLGAWEGVLSNYLLTMIDLSFVPSAEFSARVANACG